MSDSGDGCMTTIVVSVAALLFFWLVAAIGSSGDGEGNEPTCTTAEHCEQQQFWREQDQLDRDR